MWLCKRVCVFEWVHSYCTETCSSLSLCEHSYLKLLLQISVRVHAQQRECEQHGLMVTPWV